MNESFFYSHVTYKQRMVGIRQLLVEDGWTGVRQTTCVLKLESFIFNALELVNSIYSVVELYSSVHLVH